MILAFNDYQETENLDNLKNLALNYGIKVENINLTDPIRNYYGNEKPLFHYIHPII